MDLDPVTGEYVKTVYQLEAELSRQIRTTEIAEAIDRTRASVSHMIQKLDDRGLVDYTQYKGVTVTESGEAVALNLVRKHRLVETFLTETLDVSWADVHEEADRLEHHISDEFADRLAAFLGYPQTDPHGDPIPDADLCIPAGPSKTELIDCNTADTLVIEQVPHRQADVREYLFQNDIGPGSTIVVDEIAPVGLVTVTVETTDQNVSIPDHIARQIKVRHHGSPTEQAEN